MSKSTLIIAAASASAGAALTALILGPSRKTSPPVTTTTTTTTSQVCPSKILSAPPPIPATRTFSRTASLVDPSGWFAYGAPGPINDFARRTAFMSSYDRRMRNPAWVAEHITAESLAGQGGDRNNSVFMEDEQIPEKFRGKLKDYFRSGYDRGHQAPARDCQFSQTAMDETFYLSNMCPQVGNGFNRDYWAHFEDFCRKLTRKYQSVRIVTGPLYLPRRDPDGKFRVTYEVIGTPASIAVPTHFYKVIVAENVPGQIGPVTVGAFVLPNAVIANSTPLTEFSVPVEIIERASGLDFLSHLPVERRKSLCAETECSITVRDFSKKNKEIAGKR